MFAHLPVQDHHSIIAFTHPLIKQVVGLSVKAYQHALAENRKW